MDSNRPPVCRRGLFCFDFCRLQLVLGSGDAKLPPMSHAYTRRFVERSECFVTRFARPNSLKRDEFRNGNFPIADQAGIRLLNNCVDNRIDTCIVDVKN